MNSKNSILLVDPEFDPNTAENCNLLIKITSDSFSYAIIDKIHQQIKAVYDQQECHDVPAELAERLKHDSYLMLTYKEIKISVYTENTIAVPNEIFEVENLDQYARFFTETQGDKLYIQPFATYGFTSIFSLHKFIDELLNTSLECSKFFDHESPVLALAGGKKKVLQLDFSASSFNALYVNDGKLIFSNYYQIENSEEFNYYLLFIVQQLQIDTAHTVLSLSGIIHQGDAHYECVSKYFSHIEFSTALNEGLDGRILEDMPSHYYSSLLALDLCG
ncbi:DUF3822 family protein [Pedobacter sp. GR22-6]|uniref:DUF3822 family protein n=1 Tax=Pedobacter sp. GR22-6 TaxID=3127957 RepID=UPI00307D404D